MGQEICLSGEIGHIMQPHKMTNQRHRNDEEYESQTMVLDRLMKFRFAPFIQQVLQVARHVLKNVGVFADGRGPREGDQHPWRSKSCSSAVRFAANRRISAE